MTSRTCGRQVLVIGAIVVPASIAAAQTTGAAPRPTSSRMSAAEIEAFLRRPLVGRFAAVRADASPQITPMWYLYEDGVIYMSTRGDAAKVKHIRKNPKAALLVDIMEAPRRNIIVTIEGEAEIVSAGANEMTMKIRRRYETLGPHSHPPAHERRVIVKLRPRRIEGIDTTR